MYDVVFKTKNIFSCLNMLPLFSFFLVTVQCTVCYDSGLFEKRYTELDNCIASYQELLKVQEREHHDLETRIKCYEQERMEFEKERASWKEELDQARQEIIEQNDRLTVLSEQLAGRKV